LDDNKHKQLPDELGTAKAIVFNGSMPALENTEPLQHSETAIDIQINLSNNKQ